MNTGCWAIQVWLIKHGVKFIMHYLKYPFFVRGLWNSENKLVLCSGFKIKNTPKEQKPHEGCHTCSFKFTFVKNVVLFCIFISIGLYKCIPHCIARSEVRLIFFLLFGNILWRHNERLCKKSDLIGGLVIINYFFVVIFILLYIL